MRTNGTLQLFPLLRLAAALAAGIFVGYEWGRHLPEWSWLTAFVVSVALTAVCRHKALLQGALLMGACFFLGGFLLIRHVNGMTTSFPDAEVPCQAVLISEPQQRGKVIRADMQVVGGDYDGMKVKASVLRDSAGRYAALHVGQGIEGAFRFRKPDNFADTPFNYPLYLMCRGFTATAFVYHDAWRPAKVSLRGWSHLQRTRLVALQYRQRILQGYLDMGIGDEEAAVAVAMTLGDRSRLTNELRDTYSMSGASHILALSGMHLGIIYLLFSFLLGFGRWQWLREILIIAGIWAYVFLTGLSPSAVRAAVMITIYSIVSVANRNRMSLNALALAALVMLIANPLMLYDVGFQMSFLAVLSILVLYPPVYGWVDAQWLSGHKVVKWAWAMVVLSCCAQLGVAPLTAYYFGRFSVYFLLTNFAVIPLATLLLYLSVALVSCMALPTVASWIAKAVAVVASWLNAAVQWISSLPGSHIEDISLTRLQVLLIYVFIVAMLVFAARLTRHRFNSSARNAGV